MWVVVVVVVDGFFIFLLLGAGVGVIRATVPYYIYSIIHTIRAVLTTFFLRAGRSRTLGVSCARQSLAVLHLFVCLHFHHHLFVNVLWTQLYVVLDCL